MTYPTVRAKLVSIVEATTPTDKRLGAGSRFKHEPTASEGKPPPTRGFFLRATGGAVLGYHTSTRPKRHRLDVDLSVAYRTPVTDAAALDEVIEADRIALSASLLDTSQWDAATTKIDAITGGLGGSPDPEFLQTRQRDVDGARLLTFSFPLRYRE